MINIRVIAAFLVIAVVAVLLSFGPNPGKTKLINSQTCVEQPDPLHTVEYNNAVYRRIKQNAAIFWGEIPYHFQPTIPSTITVEGLQRKAYVPWYDGILDGKYITWKPVGGIPALLFVETTVGNSQLDSGFSSFDIYVKPIGGQYILPQFIQIYCTGGYPVVKKSIRPDKYGNVFPPAKFNTSALENWIDGSPDRNTRPPAVPYYIIAYDIEGTPTWLFTLNGNWPAAELTIAGNNGITKKYKAYYVSWSSIGYIMLVDIDSANSNPTVGYRYTYASNEFQPPEDYLGLGPQPSRANLQMETFNDSGINAWGWWNPECKPALYLYPEKKTDVHVIVNPAGYLTHTDPEYSADGWRVTAYPDGTILYHDKQYPYLYYESKIFDSIIDKPETGYVVTYKELPSLFSSLLPKLGLNAQETEDFKQYWEKVLHFSNFYFVGVMTNEAIDKIEPLTISPKEDTIIRVRLYFEALENRRVVLPPKLNIPARKGFTVIEWGGLVKVDQEHPFTCSQ